MNKFIHNNYRQTGIFNEEFFMSSDDGKFSYILGKLKPGDRYSSLNMASLNLLAMPLSPASL